MELEIIKREGKTFLLMPDELIASKSSSEAEARLAEAVRPRDDEIAHLKEEVGRLESPEHAQEVFTDFARRLTPEGFVELAGILGYEAQLPEASVAEVAEAEGPTPAPVPALAPDDTVPVAEPVAVAQTVIRTKKPYQVFEDPHDDAYQHFLNLGMWVLRPKKVT